MFQGITWQNAVGLTIFLVMCGFIAYWGDLLGRRMGKRRLSIFGLRPRYTAIVVTTFNGVLIALLTIVIMASVSQRVRLLVTQGLRIVEEQEQLQGRLNTIRKKYNLASTELQIQTHAADKALSDAKIAQRQLDLITIQRTRLERLLAKLEADLHRNQGFLLAAEARLSKVQGDLSAAREEILTRRADIEKQKKTIAELNAKRDMLIKLGNEMANTVQQKLLPEYVALRTKNIDFRAGDEIARRVIKCSDSKAEINRQLSELIGDADARARKAGAVAASGGRAIELRSEELKGQFVPESDIIGVIVDNISADSGSVVVRIISVCNSVEGEQARVDFALNANRRVYSAGEEVASMDIDGGKP